MAIQEKRTYLEWFKEANQQFTIRFDQMKELLEAQTTLEPGSTPSVALEELTSENPEAWTDRSGDVTIGTPAVVDAVDEDGNVCMEDGAVQFAVTGESRADPPLPGDIYSFLIIANRADDPTLQVAGRAWLRIMP